MSFANRGWPPKYGKFTDLLEPVETKGFFDPINKVKVKDKGEMKTKMKTKAKTKAKTRMKTRMRTEPKENLGKAPKKRRGTELKRRMRTKLIFKKSFFMVLQQGTL